MDLRRLLLILLAVTLTGCLPIPNERYYAPKIIGTVSRNGSPVPDADVILTAAFFKEPAIARTDKNGNFKVGPIRELHLIAPLLGDPLYGYSLKIKIDGVEYPGYADSSIGNPSDTVLLKCDLDVLYKPYPNAEKVQHCSDNVSLNTDASRRPT